MPWPIGEERGGGKRFAQSAERNKGPILEILRGALPASGLVLEIGSGTGQHAVHFARALPGLVWQPSDADPELRASVRCWVRDEALPNVREPIALDVLDAPWAIASADAVVCINMIHVSAWESTLALFAGARSSGARVLFLYGPYRRFGAHTAPSNEQFDASLRANDSTWGLRDLEAVEEVGANNGFDLADVVPMPANNFSVVFRRQ
jgi:SAM-dependent methyltransferase